MGSGVQALETHGPGWNLRSALMCLVGRGGLGQVSVEPPDPVSSPQSEK